MKIKADRVKDLEKFGFKKTFYKYMEIVCDYYKWISKTSFLSIRGNEINKTKIKRIGYRDCFNYETIEKPVLKCDIKDLISADMVEE